MDAFDRLRAADPVDPDVLPDADSPHARALYEELTMPTSSSTSPVRRRLAVAGAVVSVLALVAIGVVVAGGLGTTDDPDLAASDAPTAPDSISPPGAAMCVETYSLETLPNRDFAFDGTLTAMDGDRLTFAVNETFAGDVDDPTVLGGGTVVAGATTTSAAGPDLQVGDRALVAGSDGFAWGCGFTQPYDPAVADQWRETLG